MALIEVQTLTEFERLHGSPRVATPDPHVWLYADGARIREDFAGPVFYDPPADPLSCLQARRKWNEVRLALAESHFHRLRGALLNEAPGYKWDATIGFGPDPGDGKAALLALRTMVIELRERLNAINAAIAEQPEIIEARRRADHIAQQQAVAREREFLARNTISQITI
jgi:hypothetical protein